MTLMMLGSKDCRDH